MDTVTSRVCNRRRFLRRAVGRAGTCALSCERLYIRYLEAADAGRLPEFLSGLRYDVRSAGDVVLSEPEWLAREDFRLALQGVLGVTLQEKSGLPLQSRLRVPR